MRRHFSFQKVGLAELVLTGYSWEFVPLPLLLERGEGRSEESNGAPKRYSRRARKKSICFVPPKGWKICHRFAIGPVHTGCQPSIEGVALGRLSFVL